MIRSVLIAASLAFCINAASPAIAAYRSVAPLDCSLDSTNLILSGVRSIIVNLGLWTDTIMGNGVRQLAIDVSAAYQRKRACKSIIPL